MTEKINKGSNGLNAMVVSAIGLLEYLTEEEKKELFENKVRVEFAAGETIVKEGFVAGNIMFLDEGLVKVDIRTGRDSSTVNLLSSNSFIGIICTFSGQKIGFSATAITKTKITLFDRKLFEKFIKNNGDFAFHLIGHISGVAKGVVHHITKFSQKNMDGALSILLCDFSDIYHSNSFTLPLKRIEIAKILGYSKESVINTLSKFNKEGIISIQDKKIEILDKKLLQQIGKNG